MELDGGNIYKSLNHLSLVADNCRYEADGQSLLEDLVVVEDGVLRTEIFCEPDKSKDAIEVNGVFNDEKCRPYVSLGHPEDREIVRDFVDEDV